MLTYVCILKYIYFIDGMFYVMSDLHESLRIMRIPRKRKETDIQDVFKTYPTSFFPSKTNAMWVKSFWWVVMLPLLLCKHVISKVHTYRMQLPGFVFTECIMQGYCIKLF